MSDGDAVIARVHEAFGKNEYAGAIVEYLRWRREIDIEAGIGVVAIDTALEAFWIARASTAPTAEMLRAHEADERACVDALMARAPT